MDLQLNDKKALILASSKGIGKGIARSLSKEGCHVILSSSNRKNLESARDEIKSETGGQVDIYELDVCSIESVKNVSDQILKDHGGIDILVTNGPGPAPQKADQIDPAALEQAMQANLLSVMTLSQSFLPSMIKKGFGRIINLTSITAKEPAENMVLSNVTRAGVLAYAKTLSREVAKHGVTVNSILTGGVLTERTQQFREANAKKQGISIEEIASKANERFPVGFVASPEQFSHAITFLASPLSMNINGVSLPIDGGIMKGF